MNFNEKVDLLVTTRLEWIISNAQEISGIATAMEKNLDADGLEQIANLTIEIQKDREALARLVAALHDCKSKKITNDNNKKTNKTEKMPVLRRKSES